MTVRELIEQLSKLNPDLPVFVLEDCGYMGSSGTGWIEDMEPTEPEVFDLETRVEIRAK